MKEYKVTFEVTNIVKIPDNQELNDSHIMEIFIEDAITDWLGVESCDVHNLKIKEVKKEHDSSTRRRSGVTYRYNASLHI